jgi:hemerythrin
MKEAANLNQGGDDAPEIFMNFLRDWISKHVLGTDIKVGQHIVSLKEKGMLELDTTF